MTTPDGQKKQLWTTPADHAGRSHEYRRRSRAENAREDLLAAWYGEDLAPREIEAHQRPAVNLNTMVDQLLGKWNMADRIVLRRLVERWGEVMGAAFRKHTQPRRLEDKTLDIEVMNTVVMYKLDNPQVRQVLLQKVREIAGDEVEAIRFVVGGQSTSRPT